MFFACGMFFLYIVKIFFIKASIDWFNRGWIVDS